jgi:translation initiation factor IF-3
LNEGHKVKITIMFRGRESAHPELGKKILDRIVEKLTDIAKVESAAKLDGRNMIMVLGPDKKAKPKAAETPKEVPVGGVVPSVSVDAVESSQVVPNEEVVPSVSVEVSLEES